MCTVLCGTHSSYQDVRSVARASRRKKAIVKPVGDFLQIASIFYTLTGNSFRIDPGPAPLVHDRPMPESAPF